MSIVKLLAVGDISLEVRDKKHPFGNVRPVFANKDILFGNLEVVLSSKGKKAKKAVLLHSPPQNVRYLVEANFDVLNIANNHILDMGWEGFRNTVATLRESQLEFIGTNSIESVTGYAIRQSQGLSFGFLGYTSGYLLNRNIPVNRITEEKIISDIGLLKSRCDFIIVSLHWGTENVFYPSPKQIALAHKLVDHGAALILGHHPHVIQGIEKYNNGLIAYSLGNFQFNPAKSQSKTNQSIILRVDFNKDSLTGYDVIPIKIDNDFVPCLIKNQEKNEISHFVSEISKPIIDGGITNRWWFEQIANEYLSGNMRSFTVRIRKYGIRPLLECAFWLITPFCIACYLGLIRKFYKNLFNRT